MTFQEAIASLYVKNRVDFQSIPPIPSGDGGLDGLSDGQSVGYCCYGLDLVKQPSKKPGQLKKEICEKFAEDLRKLLELEKTGAKLAHKDNPSLPQIFAPSTKLKRVILVCNWFDSKALIGALNTVFKKYKKASKCRYVTTGCKLVIMGPRQLASTYTVDDFILARLEQHGLLALLDSTDKAALPPDVSGFDGKFKRLRDANPGQERSVDALRAGFMELWCEHMKKMEELNNKFPDVHRRIHQTIDDAGRTASLKSMGATAAVAGELIEEIRKIVTEKLGPQLPEGYSQHFVEGIVASLIGECPLRWQ